MSGSASSSSGRLYDNISVVLRPEVLERFDLAVTTNGEFLFPEGLTGKLAGKARVVPDANIPLGTGNVSPIVVGDWRRVHFFARKALAIEADNGGDAFIEDTTRYRAVERYGAALVKPDAMELLTGVDHDHMEGGA